MVDYFSVEYKTFIIVTESLLRQVDFGLNNIEKYFFLQRCCQKGVINIDFFASHGNKVITATSGFCPKLLGCDDGV